MFWPIIVIVLSNILYNITTKMTPQTVSPFLALTVTYLVAGAISALLYALLPHDKPLVQELGQLNWTSLSLAFSLVFLEAGYIYLYRAGWKISVGSLMANSLLAISLIAIGLVFFGEVLSLRQMGGIAFCLIGLILINI